MAQRVIRGQVTDPSIGTLPGVTILIKGTSRGTTTDADGSYSISIQEGDEVLVFNYVGYKVKEVEIGNQSTIDVNLTPDISELEEVVVVGYGSQRKQDITGAVAVVDVEQLGKSQYLNVTDRLQGRVPGVTVTTGGEPGQVGEIKIRGTAFFGGNDPLFVIDGVLTEDSPNLNPNDVESIQVLKDAASSAIYGSRAANGVIVITTKRGKIGEPEINISTNIGIQQIGKKLDVMNSANWAANVNAAADASGQPRQIAADDLSHGYDTDWQKEVFNDQAVFQDLNLSVSAGTQKSRVYFSLNNSYQEGTIRGPLFERIATRLNTEFELAPGLTIGENLTVGRTSSSGAQFYQGVDFDGDGIIGATIGMLPVIPVLDPTKANGYGHGVPGEAATFIPNPVGIRDLFKNQASSTRILGNLFLNYEIIEGLELNLKFGVNMENGQEKNWWKNGQIRMTTIHQSGLSESRSESLELLLENRLTYSKKIGNHSFSVMGTYTEQSLSGAFQSADITGGFDDQNQFFQISSTKASANQVSSAGDEFESAIRSYLGRVSYNFADRYLLTANIRRDGSSKFAEENRWGTFPSVSVGWNLTNESFFNVPLISNLKFRGSYGLVGNSSVRDYAYQSLIFTTASGGVNYNLGSGSSSVIGATRGAVVNRDLKWEVLKEANVGLDLSLFDGQFELIGDYYFGDLEDLLSEVPIPATVAPGGGSPTINAVSMKRNGWEFQATYRKMTGAFQFNISANAFQTRNEIVSLPFGVTEFLGDNTTSRIGTPLGQYYILDYQGIYSQEDIDNLPPGFTIGGVTPQVGDAKYSDVNSRDADGNLTGEPDGQVSFDDDRTILDANPIPALQYGFNFEGYYKNFDFTIFFQGVAGREVYNTMRSNLNSDFGSNFTADFDPYIEGQGGTDPRLVIGGEAGGNGLPSTRFLEDGSYLRVKNIQIGYSVPWQAVSNLRIFLSGQNLFTFTEYRGLDPEFEGGVFSPGIDPVGYPNLRTVTGGFNLTF